MDSQITVTLSEAAYVLGERFKTLARKLDEHAELITQVPRGRRTMRVLTFPDLLYLRFVGGEESKWLSPEGRMVVHSALRSAAEEPIQVKIGHMIIDFTDIEAEVAKRLDSLHALREGVEGDPGDPLIKGTGIEVYRVSALLDGGLTPAQVVEDFPGLTLKQVELARSYAAAMPKMGRPYANTTFKRAVRTLKLDLLDDEESEAGSAA